MEHHEIINHFRSCTTRVKAGNANKKGAISKEMYAAQRALAVVLKEDESKRPEIIRISDRVVRRV